MTSNNRARYGKNPFINLELRFKFKLKARALKNSWALKKDNPVIIGYSAISSPMPQRFRFQSTHCLNFCFALKSQAGIADGAETPRLFCGFHFQHLQEFLHSCKSRHNKKGADINPFSGFRAFV